MSARIAINGFGRIGRASLKIILDNFFDKAKVVAINDLTDVETLKHLFKYDTAYGKYEKEIPVDIKWFSEPEPQKLPWKDLDVDVVLECTGRFVKDGAAKAHLDAGAKRVVVSAPTKGDGDIQTFLKGVNEKQYLGQNIISNASCTTNCVSPVISVMHSKFKVLKAAMTTVHAVTATQNVVDGPHKDLRRARAANYNIIPTTTGAAIATTKAIPDLEGKFDGIAMRVPVITGSLIDVTMLVSKRVSVEEVNGAFEEAVKNPFYRGVLEVTKEPLVSSDIIGNPHSAIVDLGMTRVIDGDLVKILAWYDNEWGYANRLVEIALLTTS
ncbi:type I glyceraldehyde-3-phosphate dehydrogenase [Patescibacteria group bacterium]